MGDHACIRTNFYYVKKKQLDNAPSVKNVKPTYWFPNSDATNRNPVLSTQREVATGTVSKYFNLISVTTSSSTSSVTLKISPCSVCRRKKNMDLVLCVAEQTKIIPRSGSSKSFWKDEKNLIRMKVLVG